MSFTSLLGKQLRRAVDRGDRAALKVLLEQLQCVVSQDFPAGKRIRRNAWTRLQWGQSLRKRAVKKNKPLATRTLDEWIESPARADAALGAYCAQRGCAIPLPHLVLQKIADNLMDTPSVTRPVVVDKVVL